MKWAVLLALCVSAFAGAAEKVTYSMAPTQPKYATGLIHPKNAQKNAKYESFELRAEALPDKFDWREEVEGGLVPIKDQKNCGSCWAFAASATLMDAWKIKTGQEVSIAEQELVSCNGQGWGCQGGYFPEDYQVKPGQSASSEFPYVAKNARCKKGLSHDFKIASWAYVGARGRKATDAELQQAIVDHGPLTCTVYAGSKFSRYKSGIFNTNEKGTTNHMVNVVGYDLAGKFWIMRNSWGESWGENGFMRIAFGKNKLCEDAAFVDLK